MKKWISMVLALALLLSAASCALAGEAKVGNLGAGIWSPARRTINRLLAARLVSYIASDAHSADDYVMVRSILQKHERHLSVQGLLNSDPLLS